MPLSDGERDILRELEADARDDGGWTIHCPRCDHVDVQDGFGMALDDDDCTCPACGAVFLLDTGEIYDEPRNG